MDDTNKIKHTSDPTWSLHFFLFLLMLSFDAWDMPSTKAQVEIFLQVQMQRKTVKHPFAFDYAIFPQHLQETRPNMSCRTKINQLEAHKILKQLVQTTTL